MGKIAITISTEGIQTLSFVGSTEEERKLGLEIYKALEAELRVIDKIIKSHFNQNNIERSEDAH